MKLQFNQKSSLTKKKHKMNDLQDDLYKLFLKSSNNLFDEMPKVVRSTSAFVQRNAHARQ